MEDLNKRYNMSRLVSKGGITVLLTVFTLYLTNIFPTGRIFLFSLSTIFITVMVIEYGNKAAFVCYIASALLGLFIIPDKSIMFPYGICSGYYGIIKSIIEKRNNLFVEWLLKFIFFNTVLSIYYILYTHFLALPLVNEISIFVFLIIAQLYFIIYDYCYSLAISYYNRYLLSIVNR